MEVGKLKLSCRMLHLAQKTVGSHRATVAVAIIGGKRIAKGLRCCIFGGPL